MKFAEVRDLPATEIQSEIVKIRAKLFKFRLQSTSEEMQRAGEIRTLRRDVARLKTVLRQRELAAMSQQAASKETGK
ncbi:MAG: 50S ribosomal protein L29 [Planctomycetota bacterium]